MTETTREIFDKYEVRKTKEQKKSFRDYLIPLAESYGYEAREEAGKGGSVNVVVGDPEKARVVYTAHYDTCAVMPLPNFITPKCFPIYLAYQLILTIIMFIIPFLIMFVASPIVLEQTGSRGLYLATMLGGYALLWLIIYLMMMGPANKHTANDNTSGVTLLIDIMRDMPKEQREAVAFIFFDLEELGLVGSASYARAHSSVRTSKPVINFDCVSDGKNILFAIKKKAAHLTKAIKEAFPNNDTYTVYAESKGVFYPSDQRNFELGVGVSALNKSKGGILYMDKIHTLKDTVYDEESIEFLKTGAIKLVEII